MQVGLQCTGTPRVFEFTAFPTAPVQQAFGVYKRLSGETKLCGENRNSVRLELKLISGHAAVNVPVAYDGAAAWQISQGHQRKSCGNGGASSEFAGGDRLRSNPVVMARRDFS